MRDQPDPSADPYRTLGLQPSARMAEVKRAYRRLAKAYHPDSAGEAALPRFLAIHEAYERLTTGRVRSTARPASSAASTRAEPWRADPERARAARERARKRTGQASGSRTGTAGSPFESTRRRATGSSGASSTTGPAEGAAGGPGAASGRPRGRRGGVRKATMGSTSYDEARDPADATWSGASWYGPSSGEYWIINPREYADPRKHGPGYQQRARRTSVPGAEDASIGEPTPGFDRATGATTDDAFEPAPAARAAGTSTAAGERPRASAAPAAREAGRWSAAARPAWRPAALDALGDRAGGDGGVGFDPFSLAGVRRDWLGGSADDPIRRLGLALVAWPPIGLASAAAIGALTGCASYAAACAGSDALLPWLAQAVILGPLLLLPPLARVLAGGTIGVLIALVPVTAFLLAVGAGSAPQAGVALAVLLAIAWVAGVTRAAVGGGGSPRSRGGSSRGRGQVDGDRP